MALYKSFPDYTSLIITGRNPLEAFKFGSDGSFIGNVNIIPAELQGVVPVNVVSILSSGLDTEVCTEVMPSARISDTPNIEIYSAKRGVLSASIMSSLLNTRDFIAILNRRGDVDGVSYQQTLFVYPREVNLLIKLQEFIEI